MSRRGAALLATVLALSAPATTVAQSAGDDQYRDPFGEDGGQQGSGSGGSGSGGGTAPVSVGTPGQPVPPPSAQVRQINAGIFQVNLPDNWKTVQTSGTMFATGHQTKLFDMPRAASLTSPRDYDVAPNGQRFLMIKENAARDQKATTGMVVVQNWFELLKAKVPGGK